jgi:hypothetical protein
MRGIFNNGSTFFSRKLFWSPWIAGFQLRSGPSGFSKFLGQVIKILGFENRYLNLQRDLHYPKIRVSRISSSDTTKLLELLC